MNGFKIARLLKDLTQADVCTKTGIIRAELSRIEGGRSNPRPHEITALSNLYGWPADRLLTHFDESLFLSPGSEARAAQREV